MQVTLITYWLMINLVGGSFKTTTRMINQPNLSQEQKIAWHENVKLTWNNFLARPNQASPFTAESSLQISYGMKISQQGNQTKVKFLVDCYFEPKESWVKSDKKTDNLLQHEQLHFDVAEYFARKLRREFARNDFTIDNYQTKSTAIFNGIFEEYKAYQARYDTETDHGKNHEAQAEWEVEVANLLTKSQNFAKETE